MPPDHIRNYVSFDSPCAQFPREQPFLNYGATPPVIATPVIARSAATRQSSNTVIATRLQLRAKRGRGEADAAIQNTLSLREGEADVAIQMV